MTLSIPTAALRPIGLEEGRNSAKQELISALTGLEDNVVQTSSSTQAVTIDGGTTLPATLSDRRLPRARTVVDPERDVSPDHLFVEQIETLLSARRQGAPVRLVEETDLSTNFAQGQSAWQASISVGQEIDQVKPKSYVHRWVGPGRRPYYIRVGTTAFVEQSLLVNLDTSALNLAGVRVLGIRDLSQSFLADSPLSEAGEGRAGAFSFPAIQRVASDDLSQHIVIDFGAGDGALTLAAKNPQSDAVPFAVLIEYDSFEAQRARENLEANGWVEGENFVILAMDINQDHFLERALVRVVELLNDLGYRDAPLAVLSNIGFWPGSYAVTNTTVIKLFGMLEAVFDQDITYYMGAGLQYGGVPGVNIFDALEQVRLRDLGFSGAEISWMQVNTQASENVFNALAWSTTREVGFQTQREEPLDEATQQLLLQRLAEMTAALEADQPGTLVVTPDAFERGGLEEFLKRVPPKMAQRIVLYGVSQEISRIREVNPNVRVLEDAQPLDLMLLLMAMPQTDLVSVVGDSALAAQLQQYATLNMTIQVLRVQVEFQLILAALGVPTEVLSQINIDRLDRIFRQLQSA